MIYYTKIHHTDNIHVFSQNHREVCVKENNDHDEH